MKTTIAFIALVLVLSTQTLVAQCTRTGNFISNGSDTPTKGTANLIFNANGTKEVQLASNFSTSDNGPDLHVILCKAAVYRPTTGDIIISDVLTKTSGAQTFIVPSNVAIDTYKYVLIHCVAYNHRFGYASLGNPSGLGCPTLATDSFDSDLGEVLIFPNPTKDLVKFSVSDPATVTVYDQTGRKVISNYAISKENNALALSSFPKGAYLLEVITDKKTLTKTIIKN
jgi:Electron transfer DM13/Secretion system C-terminal sorting domain